MAQSEVGLRSERGPVLLALMVTTGLVAIDSTILATAVPSVVDDLGGFSAFPWLFSIYLLAQAVSVPIYSKLADTVGRKPIILIGVVLFLLGSVLSGFAWSMPALIVFRALQGIGAGAVQPMSITIIGDIYSIQERARVQGYIASIWGIASVVGPALGGVFSQFVSWRWIFFVNIPLCILAMVLLVRDFHEDVARRRHRIDVLGSATLTIATVAIILGLLEGGQAWAWDSVTSFVVFGAGAVAIVAFVLVERRAQEPVLPLWVFSRRLLLSTALVGVGVGASLIGLSSFVPTYLERTLGVMPLVSGLAVAALTIGWPIAATVVGRLYLRIGFRSTSFLGAALVVVGAAILVAFGTIPMIVVVAIACFIVGWGFGWSAVPTLIAAQASVGWEQRGVVTGAQMFARSIGSAVGAAVFGAIANGVIAGMGGDDKDPHVVATASTWVFAAVGIVAVLMIAAVFAMPRREPAASASVTAGETGPIETQPTA